MNDYIENKYTHVKFKFLEKERCNSITYKPKQYRYTSAVEFQASFSSSFSPFHPRVLQLFEFLAHRPRQCHHLRHT